VVRGRPEQIIAFKSSMNKQAVGGTSVATPSGRNRVFRQPSGGASVGAGVDGSPTKSRSVSLCCARQWFIHF